MVTAAPAPRTARAVPERRHHIAFQTRNSEYHCRDTVCVAVRDLRSRRFIENHPALGRRLSGAIRFAENGEVSQFVFPGEPPLVGDCLFFSEGKLDTEIQTTRVCDVGRPPKDAVAHYPQ
jgi:hypothetical protein